MVQRRMFSRQITDMDTFLDMPASAQNLYFHLNMHADDDGFLGNVKTIRRMVGASEDDLKLLIAKQFLIMFDDGVVVIRDWHIHNYIQKDRYHKTIFTEDKKLIELDSNKRYQIISNSFGSETDTKWIQDGGDMDTKRIQNGSEMDTEWIQDGYKNESQNFSKNPESQRREGIETMDTECIQAVSKMDTQDRGRGRGRLELEVGKDRLEEEEEEHPQSSSSSKFVDSFISTHQISLSKYQIHQINEFKQQLNDERLVVYAMKEAMKHNTDSKVELPFSYLVKILSRYVKEHVTYECVQKKKMNNMEPIPKFMANNKLTPEKSSPQEVRQLQERLSKRKNG